MIEGIKEENEEEESSDFIAWRNSIHIWLEEVDFFQPHWLVEKVGRFFWIFIEFQRMKANWLEEGIRKGFPFIPIN
jgi:hypothetical protein